MTAWANSSGRASRSGSCQRWLPGATSVAPFSWVKSFRANIELTVSSGPGQGKWGQLASSRAASGLVRPANDHGLGGVQPIRAAIGQKIMIRKRLEPGVEQDLNKRF